MMNYSRVVFGMAAIITALMAGQPDTRVALQPGARLRLAPSDPLTEPQFPKPKDEVADPQAVSGSATAKKKIRPAILDLKPAGDPIYVIEEPVPSTSDNQWRTYQRPKVERFSRDGAGIAVHGYDVVAYRERRAENGKKEFPFEYGGITWYFSSKEHRDLFSKDPERYLPEYGGFCAYSIGNGYPATADPRVFTIEGGKLYLFFDKAVRAVWEQDRDRLVTKADQNWPELHL